MATAISTYVNELNNGTLTTWIPLSTAYPIVEGCNSAFFAPTDILSYNEFYAWDPNQNVVTSCLPEAATLWWNQLSYNTATITSLGPFVCPSAYVAAYTEIVNQESYFTACCPSGYAFVTVRPEENVGQCAGVMPSGTVTYYYNDPENTSNFIQTTEYLPVSKIIQAVQVNGYNIGSPFPTVSSTTSSSTSASPSPTLQPSPTIALQTASSSPPSSTASAVNNSTGLGAGPIVGIAVGASLVVLGAIAALAFIWYRRRQRAKQQYTTAPPLNDGNTAFEVSGIPAVRSEMEGSNAYEVQGSKPGWAGSDAPLELEGDSALKANRRSKKGAVLYR